MTSKRATVTFVSASILALSVGFLLVFVRLCVEMPSWGMPIDEGRVWIASIFALMVVLAVNRSSWPRGSGAVLSAAAGLVIGILGLTCFGWNMFYRVASKACARGEIVACHRLVVAARGGRAGAASALRNCVDRRWVDWCVTGLNWSCDAVFQYGTCAERRTLSDSCGATSSPSQSHCRSLTSQNCAPSPR